jgi:UDPglucose--hexose-1-phosphate uridylyltransferase
MSELRQDPVTHDWVIVSPGRKGRPHDPGGESRACPFCPGHESEAPDAVDEIRDDDGRWLVRALPNKFPVLATPPGSDESIARTPTGRGLAGSGMHEVIVESTSHDATLGSMSVEEVRRVIGMYARRFRALACHDGSVRQVVLFRNQGARAGTSLAHPHSQIIASPVVSPETRRRVNDEIAFYDEHGDCAQCRVLDVERSAAERVVLESPRFLSYAPYASTNPYQLQIAPLRHCPSFLDVDEAELDDLAGHLARVLDALRAVLGEPDYNLIVATPPLDVVHQAASHWYLEILPRLQTAAGFELGSRIVVNTTPPETGAAELREAVSQS